MSSVAGDKSEVVSAKATRAVRGAKTTGWMTGSEKEAGVDASSC